MEIRLGESIRRLRKEACLTQEQLAEALGVSVSAVHKWESGKASPELEMLVDIAAFFETSVDALLNYGWQKLSMGQTAQQIIAYKNQRNFEEGFRFAERALQKYPNSFDVVYESALFYYMSMLHCRGKSPQRVIALFEKAIELIDQNTNATVGIISIQNLIASCYWYTGNMDKAVEVLKQNNIGKLNSGRIGVLLSENPERAEESLGFLSDALHSCYAQIYEICIGYANAYDALNNIKPLEDMMHWLLNLCHGLKEPDTVNIIDKSNVLIYAILAEIRMRLGDPTGAGQWLREARASALRFDAAPQYRAAHGMKFYHSNAETTAYDSMGETAMAVIENFMASEKASEALCLLWTKLQSES